MSRRDKPLRRKSEGGSPKKKLLVYFEGEVTERLYVNGIRKMLARSPIHIDFGHAAGEPLKVVRGAVKHSNAMRRMDPYDEIWCLFDVETPPHGSLDEALTLAATHNIYCAVSNPCFELWLLLHVDECNRHSTTKQMVKLAEKVVPSYSEKSFEFDRVSPNIGEAVERALSLERRHDDCDRGVQGRNPSTSMWKLIRTLEKYSGKTLG